jgi:C5HC2 zinc finger/F/Y-rich N-terminus
MEADFDSTDRECVVCHYDLHLSAAGCMCNPDRFACLLHAKDLCVCDWSTRFFLFRYDISELNILADAVSGKLSAVHKWALSHLCLSLRSCVPKGNTKNTDKEEVKKEIGKNCKANVTKIEEKPSLNNNSIKKEGFKSAEPGHSEKVVMKVENKPTSLLVVKDGCSRINDLPKDSAQCQPQEEKCKSSGSSLMDSSSQLTSLRINKGTVLPTKTKNEAMQAVDISTVILHPVASNGDVTLQHKCMGIVPGKEDSSLSNSSQLLDNKSVISTSNSTSECTTSESASNTESVVMALTCKPDMRGMRRNKGGPHVANVVRKLNCTVEPLEYGIIFSGHKWCTGQVIYPKGKLSYYDVYFLLYLIFFYMLFNNFLFCFHIGFRSRVKYLSVVDPTEMCYYISEIVDGGDMGPLFMVN